MASIDEWGRARLGDLSTLVDESFPREKLSPDELLACCWDDPGAVLGRADGSAAVSVVTRSDRTGAVGGFVRLLAVHPGARRQGAGRQLLRSAEDWSFDHGAETVALDAAPPFYLWPGVDVHNMVAMLCLAESAGYATTGANLTLSMPVTFRAPVPAGFAVRRVLAELDAVRVLELVQVEWAERVDAVERGIEQGTCLAAFDDGPESSRAVAVACHSINRGGWLDPIGGTPSCRRRGLGAALLAQVCTDLMVASYRDLESVVAEPLGFFVPAGAAVSRVFRTLGTSRR